MASQSEIFNNFIFMVTFTITIILLVTVGIASGEQLQKQQTLTEVIDLQPQKISSSSSSSSLLSQLLSFSGLRRWLTDDKSESNHVSESRTFGHIRRLQMALIPILFKFGVMSAMISVLVFLALKTVFLLKALLFLNAGALLAKLIGAKLQSYPVHQQPVFVPYDSSWNPHKPHGWSSYGGGGGGGWEKSHDTNREVHVHIHNDKNSKPQQSDYNSYSNEWKRNSNNEPYRGYDSELNHYDDNKLPTFSNSYRSVDPGNYRRSRTL